MLRLRLHSWMGRLYGFTVSHLLAKDLRFHSFTVVCPGSTVPRFTVVCHGCTVSRLSATVLRFDGFTVVCHGCTVPRLPATVLQFHGFTMLQPSNRGTVEPWGGGKGHTTVGRFTVRFDGRRATLFLKKDFRLRLVGDSLISGQENVPICSDLLMLHHWVCAW